MDGSIASTESKCAFTHVHAHIQTHPVVPRVLAVLPPEVVHHLGLLALVEEVLPGGGDLVLVPALIATAEAALGPPPAGHGLCIWR